MTKKRTKPIREMGMTEIAEAVSGMRTTLAKEVTQKKSGTRSEKPATIKNLRKAIARHLTIYAEKEKMGSGGIKAK